MNVQGLLSSDDPQSEEDYDYTDLDDLQNNNNVNIEGSTSDTKTLSNKPSLPKNFKSPVWPYFDIEIPKYSGQPVCKQCGDVFEPSSATTTLRRHLASHNIIHKRDASVIKWVVCDLQAFSVVENKEWQEMISNFDPRYRFHNRHTLKDNIVELYEKKKVNIKLVLNNILGKVSFTSDIWTAANKIAFLSLTIHYIDTSWKLKNFLLDIIPMDVRHTECNIANNILRVFHEFNLAEKTLALTTNNASSMITCGKAITEKLEKEFENFSFAHYRCITHVLNLAVVQGIELIDNSIEKIRSLINCIKNSQPINDALKALSLNLLAADNKLVCKYYSNDNDRIIINDTLVLLEPFERATHFLSASKYPTHDDVRFVFFALQEHLTRYINNNEHSQHMMTDSIQQKLDVYWPILDETSQISSLLDPRVKSSTFKDELETNRVKNKIYNMTEYFSTTLQLTTKVLANDNITSARNYFHQLKNPNNNNFFASSEPLANEPLYGIKKELKKTEDELN
ncbi:9397_t:CDS:2 [Cetraspora pellucida]|uniref:9397_t:CDS:1 n=1 Tax=Cetraspora pellucida TaxID=1433469 RepID=A0A9N9HL51_9GLOM|nr:9397_t:CDS:2 [Cetraspora pellucida]